MSGPNLTRSQGRLLWLIYTNQPIQPNHLQEVFARSPEVFQFALNKLDDLGLVNIGLYVTTTGEGRVAVIRKWSRRLVAKVDYDNSPYKDV